MIWPSFCRPSLVVVGDLSAFPTTQQHGFRSVEPRGRFLRVFSSFLRLEMVSRIRCSTTFSAGPTTAAPRQPGKFGQRWGEGRGRRWRRHWGGRRSSWTVTNTPLMVPWAPLGPSLGQCPCGHLRWDEMCRMPAGNLHPQMATTP